MTQSGNLCEESDKALDFGVPYLGETIVQLQGMTPRCPQQPESSVQTRT